MAKQVKEEAEDECELLTSYERGRVANPSPKCAKKSQRYQAYCGRNAGNEPRKSA